MDDGALQSDKKSFILHTQGYTESEVLLLSKELNEKFKLSTKCNTHIKNKHKYFVIYFNRASTTILKELVIPYIHLSMIHTL
jgi:hypothetical protein